MTRADAQAPSVHLAGLFGGVGRSLIEHCGYDRQSVALALETALAEIAEPLGASVMEELQAYAESENLDAPPRPFTVRECMNVLSGTAANLAARGGGDTVAEAMELLRANWPVLWAEAEKTMAEDN